jgi:hypothetical protein
MTCFLAKGDGLTIGLLLAVAFALVLSAPDLGVVGAAAVGSAWQRQSASVSGKGRSQAHNAKAMEPLL